MFKKLISIIGMIICLTANNIAGAVTPNYEWAEKGVEYCKKYRILQGDERGRLNLGGNLTREQMAKMVAVAYRKTGMTDNPSRFSDVTENMWSHVYIVAIQDYISDKTAKFRPGDFATREEFIECIVNASQMDIVTEDVVTDVFSDSHLISEDKRETMNTAVYCNFVMGDERGLRPQDRLTRAEACVLFERILASDVEVEEPKKIPVGSETVTEPEDENDENELPEEDVVQEEIPETITPETEIWDDTEVDTEDVIDDVEENQEKNNETEESDIPIPTNPKYQMTKTDIVAKSEKTVEEAIEWAKSRGAAQIFIDAAPIYWKYGEIFGIRADVMYAQAAKETAFGNYTGKVKPEMNNWAGIKKYGATGDATEDHDTFPTQEDGIRAHFNHMSAYVGVEPVGETHGRYKSVITLPWAGTVRYVEQLGGKWCPDPNYGYSIMTDYVEKM